MNRLRFFVGAAFVGGAICSLMGRAADVKPTGEFAKKATWSIPEPDSVREQALAWLKTRQVDDATRAQLEALWSSAEMQAHEGHVLDLLAVTFAAADPRAVPLVNTCAHPRRKIALPEVTWLIDPETTAFERDNLRLLYGRWLTQESLYDEALVQVAELEPSSVVDPATLLFYQSVIYHRMLDRKAGLLSIGRLSEQESAIPKRYTSVARLMQADLESLQDESLDHISRRMEDIRRRLDLGRAGPKVREVEDGVIASLDKMIDDAEKAQQEKQKAAREAAKKAREKMKKDGQQRQKNQQPQKARPDQPLDESQLMPDNGPGEVDNKRIGDQSGWGDLPEHKRAEALQQIGQEFPAHYRDMIEQYFRKLASEAAEETDK